MQPNIFKLIILLAICLYSPNIAGANEGSSPALLGFIGLNTVPSARMDKVGTIRAGVATLDPYMHGYIGVQIAQPLHINIRQSAEISSLTSQAKRLYPDIDIKLRLQKERAYMPEISIGMQSIIKGKSAYGEYIALSKKYRDFDFTAGINGFISNNAKAFGGVEYFTKFNGLSLKLDYGANNYKTQTIAPDFNPASPWGAGLAYTYNGWASFGLGIQGGDKIFAQLSLQSSPSKWALNHRKYTKPKPFYKMRGQNANITAMKQDAQNDDIELSKITINNHKIYANLKLSPSAPSPQQIGRAARHIAMHSGQDIEEINITPSRLNLRGANIKIMRLSVENSVGNDRASPQELWKNASFVVSGANNQQSKAFSSTKWINNKKSFTIDLENHISLSEPDTGILYRSAALVSAKSNPFLGVITGSSLRVNIHDNLDKIAKLRAPALNPVRSDIYEFTQKRISLENSYIAYAHSLTPEIHAAIMAGYLEEFYAGYGGELLYRPFGARFALGGEIWQTIRRSPYSPLNMWLQGERITSGNINIWYDLPRQNVTLNAKAGRFLAGDNGLSLGIEKIFKNGAKLSANTALSTYAEPDSFGDGASSYHSLKLSLPLGSIKYIPEGSKISTKISPLGRDVAQRINPPLRLFEMTENLTLDHMANHWLEIMD